MQCEPRLISSHGVGWTRTLEVGEVKTKSLMRTVLVGSSSHCFGNQKSKARSVSADGSRVSFANPGHPAVLVTRATSRIGESGNFEIG